VSAKRDDGERESDAAARAEFLIKDLLERGQGRELLVSLCFISNLLVIIMDSSNNLINLQVVVKEIK
jgi:hypothetical protein